MKIRTRILIYFLTFLLAFAVGALVRIRLLGSAPNRLLKVDWKGTEESVLNSA